MLVSNTCRPVIKNLQMVTKQNFIKFSTASPSQKFSNRNRKNSRIVDYVQVEGEMLYGICPVAMALESGQRTFHRIYYNDPSKRTKAIVELAKSRGIPCEKSDRQILNTLSKHSTKEVGVHQGVCADVEPLFPKIFNISDLEAEAGQSGKLYLFLCGLSDPFNLGAVLRSAYFLGVDRVLIGSFKTNSAPLSPVVSKASSGVLEIFTPEIVRWPEQFLEQLQTNGEDFF